MKKKDGGTEVRKLFGLGVLLGLFGLMIGGSVSAREVVVAVVDTGIDPSHPALRPFLWVNPLESQGALGVDDDGNGYVDDLHGFNFVDRVGDVAHRTINDHGTHVAGLVLRGFFGPPEDVRLMIINVYGSSVFSSPVEALDEGIRYAVHMGADLMNISATSRGESESTSAALAEAERRGTLVVTAAGNEAVDLDQVRAFPAGYADRYSGVIVVAAVDVRTGELCGSSSFGGGTVWLAAPGCDRTAPRGGILSTRKGGLYGYKAGTSMAAPLVSGGIASWMSHQRRLGWDKEGSPGEKVRRWLAELAVPAPQLVGRVAVGGTYGVEKARWEESEFQLRGVGASAESAR